MSEEYTRPELLASTAWLNDHLNDPDIRVVDMRGYVRLKDVEAGVQEADYQGAYQEYAQGHLPGAIYLDWTTDIVDLSDPVQAQVAPPAQIEQKLGQVGIGNNHTVVIYDNHPSFQFATRLAWVLGYYGHERVKILNGGLARWQGDGYALTTEVPHHPPAVFMAQVRPNWRITAEELNRKLGEKDFLLLDARDEGQYAARLRRGERAGRIPGAVHMPRESIVDPATGLFRPAGELRQMVENAGVVPGQPVVAYCNGGVAATSVLFALRLLGHDQLTNYDGSWNEWSNRPDLPVEK